MAANVGVYEIRCAISGKSYVGSSRSIRNRWSHHRRLLRKGIHPSPRLQQAWNKHGEVQFVFSVLEECSPDDLFAREQAWIDAQRRDYNSMSKVRVWTQEMRAKHRRSHKLRGEAITHCPYGHDYTAANTHVNAAGKRICRRCNADRVARIRASETPDQREQRRLWFKEHHMKHREVRIARMREYHRMRNG